MVWAVAAWIVVLGPASVGSAVILGWWALPFAAACAWGTRDFLRRGSLGDQNLPLHDWDW